VGFRCDDGLAEYLAVRNDEVIIMPHLYPTYGGHWVRLVAFSTTGGVVFNHKVTHVSYEIPGRLIGRASFRRSTIRLA
jgi:hypothetical protein